jgi:hypothetical protein
VNRRFLAAGAALLAAAMLPAAASAAPQVFFFPPDGVLRWAIVSDSTPCAGRPIIVLVGAQHPTQPAMPLEVYVDGEPGQPQFLQYFGPMAQKKIPLFAITRDRTEDREEITIDVQDCPAVTSTLRVLHNKNPYHRDRVDFRAVLKGRRQARAYHWFFGDGTEAVTTGPFVSHDYSASVKPEQQYSYFSAIVQETGSGLLTGKRIALGSSFDLSRSMGFVEADVKTTVTQTGVGFVVGLDIKNHHPNSVRFGRYLKHYLPCDTRQPPRTEDVAAESVFGQGATVTRPPGALSPGFVTVGSGRTIRSRLVLSLEKIPSETCALGFNLIGEAAGRRPVYGSFYLPVRRNPRFTARVNDEDTLFALKDLVEDQLVPNAFKLSGEDLYLLEQRGLVERTQGGWRRTQ